jgi:hypothetical protein
MTSIITEPRPTLIIRDLPGIASLEGRLLLYRNRYEGIEQDFCEKAALELFGVSQADVGHAWCLQAELLTAFELTDDETMDAMLTLGIDFSDERGHPLRCTLYLAPAVELAVRGIAGHLPDEGEAVLKRIASNLEREREAFISRKRRALRS